ncbi:hypothetical protein T12_15492 [Trichinella patagoniensis]|uniref:Uncharacterized protein n=1 Tax=Trichinella patagoniensis TaxID=990121 RepID=A0A0V1A0I6_9BILA|nr:hypothetical protein T12_15492 [Trichinella patagoniensis]
MESQLSGQMVSVMPYTCHNSGGQLLKKRQNEMDMTARLFRPGEAAQYKRSRNHPGYLIVFRRFRPPDAESSQEKCIIKSEEGGGTIQERKLFFQTLEPLLSYHFDIGFLTFTE